MELIDDIRGDLFYFHFDEDGITFTKTMSLVSMLENSCEIVAYVKGLKDAGNDFFKKGNFSSAMDKYEIALRCLAFLHLEGPDALSIFHDLVISLTLNLAVCSLKLKDFWRTGQLCSMVLKYDSNNVKAFYRRAVAALELNRPDLAHTDLVKAAQIEPSNQEVHRKWEYVEKLLNSQVRKRKNEDQVEPLPNQKCRNAPIKSGVVKDSQPVDRSSIVFPLGQEQIKCDISSSNPSPKPGKNNPSQPLDEGTCSATISSVQNNDLAELKIRFYNRQRLGSLNISRSLYESLLQGKQVSFHHPYQATRLTIRACPRIKKEVAEVPGNQCSQEEEVIDSNSSSIVEAPNQNMEQGEAKGPYFDGQNCNSMVSTPASCSGESGESFAPPPNQHILFKFGCTSRPQSGRRKYIKHKALMKFKCNSLLLRISVGSKRKCWTTSKGELPVMSSSSGKRQRVDFLHLREDAKGEGYGEVMLMEVAEDGLQASTHWTMVGKLPDVPRDLNFIAHGSVPETREG